MRSAPRAALCVDRFCLRGELRFRRLHGGRQVVGFYHPLERRVFDFLDFGLGEGDLVLDRVVFLVGLDRHRLLPKFRQAARVHRDIFFERGARAFVDSQFFLGAGDVLPRRLQPRREPLLVLRFGGQLFPRGVRGAIEFL